MAGRLRASPRQTLRMSRPSFTSTLLLPTKARAPLSLLAAYPAPPKDFFYAVPSASGGDADVYIAPKYYGPVFASDVPAATASVQAVTQRPLTNRALNEKAPAAEGWKTIPSWYVVGDADKVIPPALQMKMAERAKSHISHVNGSHPSMIEHRGDRRGNPRG
jgi:pimeloyl-ACP methyl ester carboxylesterase